MGIAIPRGIARTRSKLVEILSDNKENLSPAMLRNCRELYEEFERIDKQIDACNQRITEMFKKNKMCQRLATIPGIGELTATILAAAQPNQII